MLAPPNKVYSFYMIPIYKKFIFEILLLEILFENGQTLS